MGSLQATTLMRVRGPCRPRVKHPRRRPPAQPIAHVWSRPSQLRVWAVAWDTAQMQWPVGTTCIAVRKAGAARASVGLAVAPVSNLRKKSSTSRRFRNEGGRVDGFATAAYMYIIPRRAVNRGITITVPTYGFGHLRKRGIPHSALGGNVRSWLMKSEITRHEDERGVAAAAASCLTLLTAHPA